MEPKVEKNLETVEAPEISLTKENAENLFIEIASRSNKDSKKALVEYIFSTCSNVGEKSFKKFGSRFRNYSLPYTDDEITDLTITGLIQVKNLETSGTDKVTGKYPYTLSIRQNDEYKIRSLSLAISVTVKSNAELISVTVD